MSGSEFQSVRQLRKSRADAQMEFQSVRQLRKIRADAQIMDKSVPHELKSWC